MELAGPSGVGDQDGANSSLPPTKLAKLGTPRTGSGAQKLVQLPRACVLRIEQELRQILKEPTPFIHVHSGEEDILNLSALIIGPSDTPYAGGFFHFDISISSEYPHKPPRVTLRTTDGGRVRFNPNLYACGKVCLSILGTWSGPAWSSAHSISSVLLSIQSLMSPKPYHNEPGYENRNDPAAIQNYNAMIEHEVMRVAVCGMIEHPTCGRKFEDVIQRHFLLWYDTYERVVRDRLHLDGTSFKDPFREGMGRFCYAAILSRLQLSKQRFLTHVLEASQVSLDEGGAKAQDALTAIQRELELTESVTGASACARENNPFIWDIMIFGPESSAWEGGVFSAEIHFSVEFPERPPFFKFLSKMFHPNITLGGIPYIPSLQVRWKAGHKMKVILEEVLEMLCNPDPSRSMNDRATEIFKQNRKAYDREVRKVAQEC